VKTTLGARLLLVPCSSNTTTSLSPTRSSGAGTYSDCCGPIFQYLRVRTRACQDTHLTTRVCVCVRACVVCRVCHVPAEVEAVDEGKAFGPPGELKEGVVELRGRGDAQVAPEEGRTGERRTQLTERHT